MVRLGRGGRGYGKEPAFLRALDEMGKAFVADVHGPQRVWTDPPGLHVTPPQSTRGCPPGKPQASVDGITVRSWSRGSVQTTGPAAPCATARAAPLRVDVAHRRFWDGEEAAARCWHLAIRREVKAPKKIKYSLSNAPADTAMERLAQMHGERYRAERTFEAAKGACGLADYQALRWRAWHHHVTMVMLAMLFIAEQRVAHQPGLALLTPRDTEGDTVAQAASQAGAGRPDQPASRAQTQRHPIPLPLATQSSPDATEKHRW